MTKRSIVQIQRRVLAAGFAVGAAALFAGLVYGQTNVNVTATITSTITCNASTTTLPFGTLSAAAINVTTPQYVSTTLACPNDAAGCYLSLNDHGNTTTPGMYSTSTLHLVTSTNASAAVTSTIAAGTEYYGIDASTTAAGAGGTLTLNSRYNYAVASNTIGALTTTTITLASTSAAITTAREVLTYPEMAISGTTPAGSYADTLTYGCTGF